jgi:methionyl-tRNA formyltransferase
MSRMSDASVIVFGYGELGAAALEALSGAGARALALVLPSNRAGADVELARACARERGVAVLVQPPRREVGPFAEELRRLAPDVLLVWSYSMILPRAVLDVPPLGVVNLHGGLLPEYRGGHVMQWAIVNGERETGVTLHFVDEGVDTGPVIAEERFPIEWGDDAATLRLKMKAAGVRLIERFWPLVAAGRAPRRAQDESRARYWRLRTPADGLIDWSATSAGVYNLVRALVRPWPGAYTFWRGRKIVVRRVEPIGSETFGPSDGARREPGTVCGIDEAGVRVATGDGRVLIREAEFEGEGAPGRDLRGLGLSVGDRLGE